MQQLPTELVQYVYEIATPNRKKALLETCKRLSDCIRPAIRVAHGHILHFPLPSAFRFQSLTEVLVDCTAKEAGELFGVKLVRFTAQNKVTIRYRSLQAYRQGQMTSIGGVESATFSVGSEGEGLVACTLLQGLKGLKTARFESTSLLDRTLTLPCVVSDSLQRLELRGVNFEHAVTPHMTSLMASVNNSVVHLRQALQLREVYLHAEAVCECTRWPATLESLDLRLGSSAFISFGSLPSLKSLSLSNVESDIELTDDAPLLEHLSLNSSLVEDWSPVELLEASDHHAHLVSLVVYIPNPDRGLQMEWAEFKSIYMAVGRCSESEVHLTFLW